MFQWLKRLFSQPPVNLQINIHIDGELKVKHEAGSGMPVAPLQRPFDPAPAVQDQSPKGNIGPSGGVEADIGLDFFSDTPTPGAGFGRDVERPTRDDKESDSESP